MLRNRLNYGVDALALLAMVGLFATGWVIHYTLPAGTGGHGRGLAWTLWGWTRHDWGDLHFWLAIGAVGLLLVHLVLHWGWVCATTQSLLPARASKPRRLGTSTRAVLGIGTLAVLIGALGLFVRMAGTQAVRPLMADAGPSRVSTLDQGLGDDEIAPDDHAIRGSMTLEQVATAAGVSIDALRQRLGLSDVVANQEKIGRLMRQQGSDVSAVRAAVADLKASAGH